MARTYARRWDLYTDLPPKQAQYVGYVLTYRDRDVEPVLVTLVCSVSISRQECARAFHQARRFGEVKACAR